MATTLEDLYTELGNAQQKKLLVQIAGGAESPTQTGISVFKQISQQLQKACCGSGSIGGNNNTQSEVKAAIEAVIKQVLPAAVAAFAGPIAEICVYLFFNVAGPLICRAWADWNNKPDADPYQPNPAFDASVYAHH